MGYICNRFQNNWLLRNMEKTSILTPFCSFKKFLSICFISMEVEIPLKIHIHWELLPTLPAATKTRESWPFQNYFYITKNSMDFNLKVLRIYIKNTQSHTYTLHILTQWLYKAWEHKRKLSHGRQSPDFVFHRQIACFTSLTLIPVLTRSYEKESSNIINPSDGAPWSRRVGNLGNSLEFWDGDSVSWGWVSLRGKPKQAIPHPWENVCIS